MFPRIRIHYLHVVDYGVSELIKAVSSHILIKLHPPMINIVPVSGVEVLKYP